MTFSWVFGENISPVCVCVCVQNFLLKILILNAKKAKNKQNKTKKTNLFFKNEFDSVAELLFGKVGKKL